MSGNATGPGDFFGYQTDYGKRAQLVRTWHQTGEDREPGSVNPLYYGDTNATGDLQWTVDPKSLNQQPNATQENIDTVQARIQALDSGQVTTAAGGWRKLYTVFDNMISAIGKKTQAMADGHLNGGGWSSPAADVFYARGPGATMKSLTDWRDAASANERALNDLSTIIDDYQGRMQSLYDDYVADRGKLDAAWNDFWSGVSSNMGNKAPTTGQGLKHPDSDLDWTPNVYIDMVKRHRAGALKPSNDDLALNDQWEVYRRYKYNFGGSDTNWNQKAATLQYQMGQAFSSGINTMYSEGRSTRYEGPLDAVTVDPNVVQDVLRQWMMSNLPGAPGVGNPSFSAPPSITPPMVITPNLPAVPKVPEGAFQLAPMNLPNANNLPDVGNLPSPDDLAAKAPTGLAAPDLGNLPDAALPGLLGMQGLLGPNVGAPNLGLSKGLLSAPNGLSGPNAPPSPFSARNLNKEGRGNLQRGVLGSRRSTFGEEVPAEDEQTNSGMPPSAGRAIAQGRDARREQAPGSPVARETFGEGTSTPTAPPVLKRSQDRTERRLSRFGPQPEAPSGRAFTPDGTTRPVLGRSQAADAVTRGTSGAPASPAGPVRREARPGDGAPPPPGDMDWLTRQHGNAPPPSAPVLDGSGRMTEAERAGSAWSDRFTAAPTQAGATAPVLGRPASAATGRAGVPALGGGHPTEQELAARHRTMAASAMPAAAPEEQVSSVISDETAFSVETPGGAVLGGDAGRPNAPEAEPKPTLGGGQ